MKPLKPLAKLLVEHVTALEMPMPKSIMCTHHGIGVGRVGLFGVRIAPGNFTITQGLTVMVYLESRFDMSGAEVTFGQDVFNIIRAEVSAIGRILTEWNGPNDGDRPRAGGITIVVKREIQNFIRAVDRYHWMGHQGRTFKPDASDKAAFRAFDRALKQNLRHVRNYREA